MRMPEPGPFGETFFEASERAISGAPLVKRSSGGCVESVVTFFTQRFLSDLVFAADFLLAGGIDLSVWDSSFELSSSFWLSAS